jgi:hypothetical protein
MHALKLACLPVSGTISALSAIRKNKMERSLKQMKENTERVLSDAQKILVTLGAAIGGGCGKCAENLIKIAREQGVTAADMAAACQMGFTAKSEAVKTMKDRVAAILKAGPTENGEKKGEDIQNLASLIRAAVFTAANSAPDVIKEASVVSHK